MWQRELESLQCKSLAKGQEITGMPFNTGISDKIGDMATEMANIETIIRGLLARVQMEKKKILEFINNIDDSYIRQIVFMRNVSCMRWNKVAIQLNNTEECVKKTYYRFLDKL